MDMEKLWVVLLFSAWTHTLSIYFYKFLFFSTVFKTQTKKENAVFNQQITLDAVQMKTHISKYSSNLTFL